MLVFIIPLKSKQVCQSWESVCRLFERTIKSICNQTTNSFRVIVVCNEKPNIKFTHPNITYIERDFVIPEADWRNKDLDKTHKLITGLIHAKSINASHIMFADADDCVSKHLAEFVNQHPQATGWLVRKGYIYRDGSKLIRLMKKGFDRYCGTSNIVRYDLYYVPEIIDEITEKEYKYCIYNNYWHRTIEETLNRKGASLESLPFAGAIYTQNGQNIYHGIEDQNKAINLKSRFWRAKALLDYRLVTQSIREEFQLYNY
ncbi:glycosyltransferase family 2 protein [Anabaena sp. CCY 0017]|uniref:glycosyltransferase family 2 protein n=1 Tax=Anabaena sp. CCY 0017 TaxID=3103866 RepID=UPI0039C6135B